MPNRVTDLILKVPGGKSLKGPLIREDFDTLYGQPLVKQVLQDILRKRDTYGKPMALSFHGPVGTGKTFLSTLISESLFLEGKTSKFVHFFTVGYHFPNPDHLKQYQENLRNEIMFSLLSCPSSVFIFDEVEKMDSKLLDTLAPFLEPRGLVGGINTEKAVFILLSNAGSKAIVHKSYGLWSNGVEREDFELIDFEDELQKAVYNEEGSFKESALIKKELIDAYVPFLPLEKSHVKSCIETEYKRFNGKAPSPEIIRVALKVVKEILWHGSKINGFERVFHKRLRRWTKRVAMIAD